MEPQRCFPYSEGGHSDAPGNGCSRAHKAHVGQGGSRVGTVGVTQPSRIPQSNMSTLDGCAGDPAAQRGPQSARFLHDRRQNQGSSIWARVEAPSDFAPRHSTVGAGTVGVALALSGKFALPFALVPAAQSWLRDMDCFPIQGIFTTSTCQMRILENFGSCPRNRTEGAGELSEASG